MNYGIKGYEDASIDFRREEMERMYIVSLIGSAREIRRSFIAGFSVDSMLTGL
jgi:hypothetical protein